jgi:hypothetical protein
MSIYSELDSVSEIVERVEVHLHHHGDLKNDGVVKFTQIQAGDFFDFFKPVNQRIAVDI